MSTYSIKPELDNGGIVELVDFLAKPERTLLLLVLHVGVVQCAVIVDWTTAVLLGFDLGRGLHVDFITVHTLEKHQTTLWFVFK